VTRTVRLREVIRDHLPISELKVFLIDQVLQHRDGAPWLRQPNDAAADFTGNVDRDCDTAPSADHFKLRPNERAFSGEPSEQSERPERRRGRRVRCNAMLGPAPSPETNPQ
jgi:hypothetical protein